MTKLLTALCVVSMFCSATFWTLNISAEQVKNRNRKQKEVTSQAQSSTSTNSTKVDDNSSSSSISNSSLSKTKTKKYKLVDGEIDWESEVTINNDQKIRYNKCKLTVRIKRNTRNKNRATPCKKIPQQVNDHITDEDYNILWESVNQQIEINQGQDPNQEKPVTDFVDINEVEIESSSSTSSSSSSQSSSSYSVDSSQGSSQSPFTSSQQSSSSTANSESSQSTIFVTSKYSQSTNNNSPTKDKEVNQISSQSSSQTVSQSQSQDKSPMSWLESILNLGTISAQAAQNDGWRLPYEKGNRVNLSQQPFGSYTHGLYTAFDFNGLNNKNVIAAKEGNVVYIGFSPNGFGNHVVIQSPDGSTAVYAHLRSYNVTLNQNLKRSDYIGVEGTTGNSTGDHLHFETWNRIPCNWSNKPENCWSSQYYLDSRMLPQFDECYASRGGLANTYPDCYNGYPNKIGFWYESINSSVPIGGFIKSYTDNNKLFDVFGGANNEGQQVGLWNYNGGQVNQRWNYNLNNENITGLGGKCLDAGDINNANNRWLRIHTCHSGTNQKWFKVSDKTLRSRANQELCVDSASGNSAGSTLYLYPCHTGNNQKWNLDDLNMSEQVIQIKPEKYAFRQLGTNKCLDAYGTYNGRQVYTWDCDWNSSNHQWQWVPTNQGNLLRQNNTNFCIDGWNPYNGRNNYTWTCDPNTSNHNWEYDSNTKLLKMKNTNYCLDSWNPTNGSNVYMWQCNANDPAQKWEAVYLGR